MSTSTSENADSATSGWVSNAWPFNIKDASSPYIDVSFGISILINLCVLLFLVYRAKSKINAGFKLFAGWFNNIKNSVFNVIGGFGSKTKEGLETCFAPKTAKAAMYLRMAIFTELQAVIQGTEAVARSKDPDLEARRCREFEASTLWRGLSSSFLFIFGAREREEDWKSRVKRLLKPELDTFVNKLAEKMAVYLHKRLPSMYTPPGPQYDNLVAIAVAHAMVVIDVLPLLDEMLDNLVNKWAIVTPAVGQGKKEDVISVWITEIVKPELEKFVKNIRVPDVSGGYIRSEAEETSSFFQHMSKGQPESDASGYQTTPKAEEKSSFFPKTPVPKAQSESSAPPKSPTTSTSTTPTISRTASTGTSNSTHSSNETSISKFPEAASTSTDPNTNPRRALGMGYPTDLKGKKPQRPGAGVKTEHEDEIARRRATSVQFVAENLVPSS